MGFLIFRERMQYSIPLCAAGISPILLQYHNTPFSTETTMCGRYYLSTPPAQLAVRFDLEHTGPPVMPNDNVSPTQTVPVILNESPKTLSFAKWGLIPFWAKDEKIGNKMFNARAEGVEEKPSFRNAFKKRRCLIPADGFYEWRKNPDGSKTRVRFYLDDQEPLAFAGLWEVWRPPGGESVRSCTIITTQADEVVAPVHDRMPVILPRDFEQAWLQTDDPGFLLSLLRPYPPDQLRAEDSPSR